MPSFLPRAQGEVDGGSLTYKMGLNYVYVEKKNGETEMLSWEDDGCDPITFQSEVYGQEVTVERPYCKR